MIEEPQEGPKWLKELEEKREKRVKARLGHEAGAGSPCLTCEEKCPGLDLHFWRKICKNCKCGKENHDVNDDDIYGWAQFQLLGSKPNKPKKMVLPGRKDAVELEWTPKGQTEVVESYLKELPVNLLPIKGSAAAQERKQLLQKQIPLHDIDPTLCHALSEHEIKQMNDYIAHVKQNSVGVGHIMKLNELLKNRHSANAQILSSRAPMQVPQVQNIVLQGVDRANSLKIAQGGHTGDLHKGLRDLSLDEQKSWDVSQSEQIASNVNNVRDVAYGTYGQGTVGNVNSMSGSVGELHNVTDFSPASQHNFKNIQNNPVNLQRNSKNVEQPQHNIQNMQMSQQPVANQIDYQNSTNMGGIRDIKYPYGTQQLPNFAIYSKNDQQNPTNVRYPFINQNFDPNSAQIPNQPIYDKIDFQNPSNFRTIHYTDNTPQGNQFNEEFPYSKNDPQNLTNVRYPFINQNFDPKSAQIPKQPVYDKIDFQNPSNFGTIHYTDNTPQGNQSNEEFPYSKNDPQNPTNVRYPFINQNFDPKSAQIPNQPVYDKIDFQKPSNFGTIHYTDNTPQGNRSNEEFPANFAQMHPRNVQNLPHYANSSIRNTQNTQKPVEYDIRNVYPDMNVNFDPHIQVGDIETNLENLDNVSSLKGDPKMPHYVPGKYNTFVEQQNPQTIGNIKDLAYSTYDPTHNLDLSNENLQKYGEKGLNPQRPANYNPNEINVTEQSLNPTSVNVGIINDIEYPTIKSAIQRQNNLFEPALPRKNVQFDLNPQEILPSCHKCKKMFDSAAIVIGIDHTDDLWHAECFKCTGCNQNLADLMYFYHKESDDIYCGRDYAKIRGIPRCQACDELIFVKEYCLAENSTFHVKHFCCFECDEPLAGQNYVMEDSQPLCLPCFEKVKAEKCNACLKVIKPDEQGANLNGVHFHADDSCFACKMCKKPLLGAKLLFKNSNLYCSAPCFGADK